MSFATLDKAREYYNSYAKRTSFSIRTNTSRRSVITKEKQKVQFVCNKEGFGRKRRVAAQLVDGITCYSDNDEAEEEDTAQEEEDEQVEKRKKFDGCKKRKREKMVYTNCKARMVVKIIGSRWQVIYFLAEHNHDLVVQPSLMKFLRSHRGIPKQEKDFIVLLHGCNLSTGRIMQLMSEFYGSAQLVPYDGKQVSNFCSTIHKTEKFKDMQETLDYFRALKEEDPEFFYKIKLDDNLRVENLFWVDSAARRAYKEAYNDCVSFDATYMTNIYEMPCTIGPILAKNDELNEEFVDCLNHTVSPEDFESKWATMVQKYGLEDNEHFQHLYHIRQSFIPADYMHSFFPFLQSTQRSEGFNALLKKFSKEFEKTAEYDVKPVGQFQYWLEPNNSFVFGYGKRNYLVTAIEEDESYCCECSKFDRDGIICCHIMRVMVRMGVKLIPERYILKRWTQQAIASDTNQVQNVNAPVGLVARGMPLTSEKTLRLTNATTAFAAIAVEGCTNDENYAILEKHIKEMRSEFEEIKKRMMANRQNTSGTEGGATEGAQDGTGVSTLTGPSLQTAGLKN
ncbi:hypothetical protein BDA96_05G096800 [Sorghum bicolor]|uniref:Protein FAR1-RELATED SEQUENCE n=1 Tax=Sorghum bicolor TaxID=4558 RepID=A0A921UF73_SORBI|nr:hypothetical protein BDA96_05G096800 [Sorghum bicolor]